MPTLRPNESRLRPTDATLPLPVSSHGPTTENTNVISNRRRPIRKIRVSDAQYSRVTKKNLLLKVFLLRNNVPYTDSSSSF